MYCFSRRKICLYLIFLTIFIAFTLNNQRKDDENQKSSVPSSPIINSRTNRHSIVNISRNEFKCNDRYSLSDRRISKIIKQNGIFNYLSFVIRSHSIFYCSVPKVATRTILIYLTYLHIRDELIPTIKNNSNVNLYNFPYIKQMIFSSLKNKNTSKMLDKLSSLEYFQSEYILNNSSKIDLWSLYHKKVFPFVRPQTLFNSLEIFSSDYLRIIFVRHPFERLASAYIDKIASLTNQPFTLYDHIRRVICRKFQSSYLTDEQTEFYLTQKIFNETISEPCEKIIPTFEHFIEYLSRSEHQHDVHWKPYTNLCFVCSLKYNFIGKFETMEKDLSRLTEFLNLNSIKINSFQNGKTKEFYRTMYSNLSDILICFLTNFYKYDLLFFNYTVEDYLLTNKDTRCSWTH